MNTLSGRSSAPASPGPTANFLALSDIHLRPPSSSPFDDGANENAPPSNPPSTARQFSSTPSTPAGNPTSMPLDPSSASFQNHASFFATNDHLTVTLDEKAAPLWTAVKENGDAIKENRDAIKENGDAIQLLREAVKEKGDIIQKNSVALLAMKKNGEAMMEMLSERLPPRPTCAEPS